MYQVLSLFFHTYYGLFIFLQNFNVTFYNNTFIFVVLAVSSHGTTTNYDGSQRSTVEFTCCTCLPIIYGDRTQSSTTSEFISLLRIWITMGITLIYISQKWHCMLSKETPGSSEHMFNMAIFYARHATQYNATSGNIISPSNLILCHMKLIHDDLQ